MNRQRVYQSRSQSKSSGLEVSGILQRRGVVRSASEPKGNSEEETKNHSDQESPSVKSYQPVPVRSQFEKNKSSTVEESGWKRSFVNVPVHGNRLPIPQRTAFSSASLPLLPPQQLPQHSASALHGEMGSEQRALSASIPQSITVPAIQAKLTIGQPNDKYEQEADRVASQVTRYINAPASTKSTEARQEEKKIQAKPEMISLQRQEAIAEGEAPTGLASAINNARGSGQPLDAGLQQSMGQAMRVDFSGVRVHTDVQSHRLNQSIQAKAFTTGQDIFFRKGAYQPKSRSGQELIAHELTHVVQQNGGAVRRSSFPSQQRSQPPAIETPLSSKGNSTIQRKEETPRKPQNKELELSDTTPDNNILQEDADQRKEQARNELLATIDKLDMVTGEDLEAVLAQLQEKYGLTKTEVDISDPENMKVELYASPALIIGGIVLGFVVIGGLGIAGYCIYKRVKYNRIITQLTGTGYTRDQARTLFGLHNNVNDLIAWAPVILRQIGDGVVLNQALIDSVQRQMGAADKIQEIQEHGNADNLQWGQQNANLNNTALGRWILDNNQPEPDPVNGNMNCWEVVMFSAYRMGYIDWQHMHDAYIRDAGRQGLEDQEEQTAYFHNHIQTGTERQYAPNDPNSPKPLRGDIVLFETAEDHTAMAAGSEIANSPEVFSLWNRPNHNYLQRVTVAALLAAGANEPVLFFSPNWR